MMREEKRILFEETVKDIKTLDKMKKGTFDFLVLSVEDRRFVPFEVVNTLKKAQKKVRLLEDRGLQGIYVIKSKDVDLYKAIYVVDTPRGTNNIKGLHALIKALTTLYAERFNLKPMRKEKAVGYYAFAYNFKLDTITCTHMCETEEEAMSRILTRSGSTTNTIVLDTVKYSDSFQFQSLEYIDCVKMKEVKARMLENFKESEAYTNIELQHSADIRRAEIKRLVDETAPEVLETIADLLR